MSKISKFKNILFIKNEKTSYGRISEGILDAYHFFLYKKPTQFCSFIHQWNIYDFIMLRLKNLFFILFCYTMEKGIYIFKKIYPYIEKTNLYNKILPVFKDTYRDIVLYSCF